MVGQLSDDHPAVRVADKHDGLLCRLDDASYSFDVPAKVSKLCRVASGAGHLLNHMDSMAVLLKQRGGLSPVPPADEPAMH